MRSSEQLDLFGGMNKLEGKSPDSIYSMHKYWGKKPSGELRKIIKKYTGENDWILDPFAGYGGIAVESVILNRNIIANDLNPIANFIVGCILEKNVNLKKLSDLFFQVKTEYEKYYKEWYVLTDAENEVSQIIVTLRDKHDNPLKIKYKSAESNILKERQLSPSEQEQLAEKEKNYKIDYWYPSDKLIENSRICAKKNTKVSDLFPKRALACHAYLFYLLSCLEVSAEKDLLIFAFTSNIANCSKLVPPIKSRGELSQGAWMTGFYVGEVYLENNVFHYFENRVAKIIKGKKDYLNEINGQSRTGEYRVTDYDAKNMALDDGSIDFIFTDFPYGSAVPYFEQSQLWNCWLKKDVDYENEIVISDSRARNKNINNFHSDIDSAAKEISRVLKTGSYFIFTFHSLHGEEWRAIANALIKNGFEFVECDIMLQKTFTPRQLNRKISLRGDLIAVYKKTGIINDNQEPDLENIISDVIKRAFQAESCIETNEIITLCVKKMLNSGMIIKDINFLDIINNICELDELNEKWRLKK